MHRLLSYTILLISFAVWISCSGTANTTQQESSSEQKKVQQYPSWYPSQNVVSGEKMMSGYATAIGQDSTSAADKAIAWAKKELRATVSDKLESIRSEALVEKGSGYGLDESRFLIALRKADNAVNALAETGNLEIKSVEGYESVRSFAEINIPKADLIERIGKRLAGYEQAWNAMKESKAFENF